MKPLRLRDFLMAAEPVTTALESALWSEPTLRRFPHHLASCVSCLLCLRLLCTP